MRAAQELQEELQRLNGELQRQWGVQIAIRTGINSGEVVAGDASAGQALVTGDAVNVAARLQQAAAPGETLIGDATRRLVGDAVDAEPLEPLAVRGKAEPLTVWRLGGTARARVTADAGAAAGPRHRAAPAARDLRAGRLRARAATRGRCSGRPASASPGWPRELARRSRDRATVLTGRCLPYGEGITFWPLAEIVRQLAGGADLRAALGGASPEAPRAETWSRSACSRPPASRR